MKYEERKKRIYEEIEKNHTELWQLNNELADHPEISGAEYESSRKIVELLQGKGYHTEYPFAGFDTAFRGIYGGNNHTHKVAILTEYDALPDIGHGCGHCLSGAISILAGLALKDLQEELDTDIHILGTPIEETDGSKCQMVKDGVFDEYDLAIMVHLYNHNLVTPKLQALSTFMYEFHGKAAHSSGAPWEGANAFNAAQLMFHAIDMLRQHSKEGAQFHGIIVKGGEAPNIVPEHVMAEIYVRAFDKEYLKELVKKVDDCATGAAIATQTTWSKYPTSTTYDNLKPNFTGEETLEDVFDELGLEKNGNPKEIFGSTDAGNVSFACPCFHPCLQFVEPDIQVHTREFAVAVKSERAKESLRTGAKIIGLQILKIFGDEEKIRGLKADFERK